MQRLDGSVTKFVNDTLPTRIESLFWSKGGQQAYFDGCLRHERHGRRRTATYRRHGICADPSEYPNTRTTVALEGAI